MIRNNAETRKIRDNVIFIISPCSEPDGEIIFTDWYYKYQSFEFTHLNGPVLNLKDVTLPYRIIAEIGKSPLVNGVCRNVELLENTPIAVDITVEAGDIYYLSFNPEFRMQNDGTFKLLFNALYK